MLIGWNGLSMPTSVCSVYMPTRRVYFKVRGLKKGLCPIYDRLYVQILLLSEGLLTLM